MNTRAFTLMEMAVVLVIVSLLVGGVMVGSSIIQQSRLKRAVTEISEMRDAVIMFREKYKSLPGDMYNAVDYWPTTQNGDGNGHIDGFPSGSTTYEAHRAWQQLASANMITGTYSGTQTAGDSRSSEPGVNIPSGSIKGSGMWLEYMDLPSGDSTHFPMTGHYIALAGINTTNQNVNAPAKLTATQAASIDTKTDDGLPATGKVITWRNSQMLCADSNDTQYATTNSASKCGLLWQMGF